MNTAKLKRTFWHKRREKESIEQIIKRQRAPLEKDLSQLEGEVYHHFKTNQSFQVRGGKVVRIPCVLKHGMPEQPEDKPTEE